MSATQVAAEIPVQALFDGDFLSFLVVLDGNDTVPEACERVAEGVVGRRIPARPDVGYELRKEDGSVVPDHLTVHQAGIEHSDYIVVAFRQER